MLGGRSVEKIIKDYKLSPEAMIMVSGSSIGTQKKYYEKGFWYKQNNVGYEGTAEYLASKVLSCSNISEFVEYERCKINGKDGCRSANFLSEKESFISLQRLYDTYHGGQLSERIRMIDTIKDRIKFVTDFVYNTTGLDIKEQIGKIATFDMLILNTDRHFNNIGIVADALQNRYKNAPVFDNGNSLLSNIGEFPFDFDIKDNIDKVVGQPFAANLERQAMELGYGLKVNYTELQNILRKEPGSRALETLQIQLRKYESLLKDNSLCKRVSVKESLLNKLSDNKKIIETRDTDKREDVQLGKSEAHYDKEMR